jgi:hypothetical protein
MGRYNSFNASILCPQCRASVEVPFQADIGYLDWRTFESGAQIFDIAPESKLTPIGQQGEKDRDFWAYAIGTCPNCRSEVWARIEIHSNRFSALELVSEPDDVLAWGYLDH